MITLMQTGGLSFRTDIEHHHPAISLILEHKESSQVLYAVWEDSPKDWGLTPETYTSPTLYISSDSDTSYLEGIFVSNSYSSDGPCSFNLDYWPHKEEAFEPIFKAIYFLRSWSQLGDVSLAIAVISFSRFYKSGVLPICSFALGEFFYPDIIVSEASNFPEIDTDEDTLIFTYFKNGLGGDLTVNNNGSGKTSMSVDTRKYPRQLLNVFSQILPLIHWYQSIKDGGNKPL